MRPILTRAGHEVSTVKLPSEDGDATTDDYVEAIQAAITSPLSETVLVAHSSSGLVASVVAEALPLRELIMAAFAPIPGMSLFERMESGEQILQAEFAKVYAALPCDRFGGTLLPPQVAVDYFYNDCPAEDLRTVLPRLVADYATGPFTERSPIYNTGLTPSRCVLCTRDRTLNSDRMRELARRRGDHLVEFDSGHSPFDLDHSSSARCYSTKAADGRTRNEHTS